MKKLSLIGLVGALVIAIFYFDLNQYLSLNFLQSRLGDLQAYYVDNALLVCGLFFVLYVLVTALSIPGAAVMTLAGGAVFGLGVGLLLVSFASSVGATLAFLVARYLLRDSVQERFSERLKTLNKGMEKDGAFYL
ncbi:MAG TPA: hypothetical protein DIW43_11470, partial [Spongiibacteraceae bacterium]|nr:hypothetical protein [Spongiibacteraceae bacterium]